MAASSSRPHVTRLELTADQLLGSDLTRARPYKPGKNAPKVITVEELLGTSLTIAGSSGRSPTRTSRRPPPRPSTRSPSPRRTVTPNLNRVTADEVLRTGLPVRTLQAAKARARSGQTITLTAEQLFASDSGSASGSRLSSRRGVPRVLSAEELAGPGTNSSSSRRRPRSAGGSNIAASPSFGLHSGSDGTRVGRPSTAGAASGSGSNGVSTTTAAGPSTTTRGLRAGQIQRSNSQGSTRTLPMYTKEPGESEVVIDRGAVELEDEIAVTVMTPVDEDFPSLIGGVPAPSPSSPVPGETTLSDFGRHHRPFDTTSLIPISIPTPRTLSLSPVAVQERDEVPSYEAAMTMSTPNLLATAVTIPLSASPASPSTRPPALSIPARSGAASPSSLSPSSAGSAFGSSNPPSPIPEGAESPRRRFPFISLFHGHSPGSSRSRVRGGSVSGLPPSPATLERGLSPASPSPRPFHQSSQSASGSMLHLISRSWSDNPSVRPRIERNGA